MRKTSYLHKKICKRVLQNTYCFLGEFIFALKKSQVLLFYTNNFKAVRTNHVLSNSMFIALRNVKSWIYKSVVKTTQVENFLTWLVHILLPEANNSLESIWSIWFVRRNLKLSLKKNEKNVNAYYFFTTKVRYKAFFVNCMHVCQKSRSNEWYFDDGQAIHQSYIFSN